MTTNLLVVTSNSNLGETLRRWLEESGAHRVFVVNNKASAVVRTNEQKCSAAFLDLKLGDPWIEEIGRSLRTVSPEIKLIVLTESESSPALDALQPWILIRKPFESEDLYRALGEFPPEPIEISEAASPIDVNLPWLSDVTKAAQHLTRLSLETSSQAALITRHAGLWAYAGQLSQNAAKEITGVLAHNWSGDKGSDLLRFIRLESTKAEHMLYATQLAEGVLLAMVFDAETPFSTIRSQAGQLVVSLSENGVKEEKSEALITNEINDMDDDGDDLVIPPISEIIIDVPSPNPKRTQPKNISSSDEELQWPRRPDVIVDPDQTRRSIFSREYSAPIPLNKLLVTQSSADLDQTVPSQSKEVEELNVTAPSKSEPRAGTPAKKSIEGTEPHLSSANEANEHIAVEPVSAGVYNLTYACLLIPRFSAHYLTGDIADHLSEWIPNICIAFGWRLEYLAVRPEYLQWVVNVPPATSPGYLMRIVRQQTSEKIFAEFVRLKKENPSGDFWAPGYLIMGGTKPHPPQLVKDYIKQIRQRQGIEKKQK
jgi:REP element-mobilizing transposase RayT/ActR/RegA family two-component response regulator